VADPPHRPDNHLLDALVGCAVAASIQGAKFDASVATSGPAPPSDRKPKRRVDIGELYRAAHPDEVF
jgi:hypothetical protein